MPPSDPLCACSDFRFTRSSDDFDDCKTSLEAYCSSATPTDDTSLCMTCLEEFDDVTGKKASSDSFAFSNGCKDALANMYSFVTCPYVAQAPFFQSCRYGFAADSLARGLATAFIGLLMAAVLAMNWLIMPVRDKHGSKDEFVLWSLSFVPFLLLALIGVQSDKLYRSFSDAIEDYHLSYLFVLLAAIFNCVK